MTISIADRIFGTDAMEYKIGYCSLCETLVATCHHCDNSSCNGGGCDHCIDTFKKLHEISVEMHETGRKMHEILSRKHASKPQEEQRPDECPMTS